SSGRPAHSGAAVRAFRRKRRRAAARLPRGKVRPGRRRERSWRRRWGAWWWWPLRGSCRPWDQYMGRTGGRKKERPGFPGRSRDAMWRGSELVLEADPRRPLRDAVGEAVGVGRDRGIVRETVV